MESRKEQIERVADEIKTRFGASQLLADQIAQLLFQEFGEPKPFYPAEAKADPDITAE